MELIVNLSVILFFIGLWMYARYWRRMWQEVKTVSEGVRNVPPQHTEEAPRIRNPMNERSPSGNEIADRVIIGRPGFQLKNENRPKGIKI